MPEVIYPRPRCVTIRLLFDCLARYNYFMRRLKKRLITLFASVFLTYVLLVILFGQILSQVGTTVAAENSYADLLELPHEEFKFPSDNWNLASLWQSWQNAQSSLTKLAGYKREVEAIESEFALQYNKFSSFAKQYDHDVIAPFVATLLPPVTEIDFKTKRKLGEYVAAKYQELRLKVKEINLAGKTFVRWNYDLDLELQVMNLTEKIGQLFILPLKGTSLASSEKSFREANNIGGAILMGENVKSESQVKQLTAQLKAPLYPAFIATDQEGGPVKRVSWDPTLGQRELAKKRLDEVCSQYTQRDNLLSGLGINVNFGLVTDVTGDKKSFLYNRVFSDNYTLAAEYAKEAVKCTTKTLTVAKHFPGHGRVAADTHKGPVGFSLALADWQNTDLVPFKSAIENGLDWIMLAHIDLKELTAGKPASLSAEANKYIRQNLGFKGLIVTDDLGMLGQDKSRNKEADLREALSAGTELMLYVLEPIGRARMIEVAKEMVNDGRLSKEELDRRVKLILEAKRGLG